MLSTQPDVFDSVGNVEVGKTIDGLRYEGKSNQNLTNILSNNDLKVHDPWWYCVHYAFPTFWPPKNRSKHTCSSWCLRSTLGTSTSHWKQRWNSKSNFLKNLMVGLPGNCSKKPQRWDPWLMVRIDLQFFTYKKMVVPWILLRVFLQPRPRGFQTLVDLNIPDVRCLQTALAGSHPRRKEWHPDGILAILRWPKEESQGRFLGCKRSWIRIRFIGIMDDCEANPLIRLASMLWITLNSF